MLCTRICATLGCVIVTESFFVTGTGAQEPFFQQGVTVKSQVVTWYLDFHPAPWKRDDFKCSIKGEEI